MGMISVTTRPKDGVKRCLTCGADATSKYYTDLRAREAAYKRAHPFKTLRDKFLAVVVFIVLALVALFVFKLIGDNFPLVNF
jgi:hypothetical protein